MPLADIARRKAAVHGAVWHIAHNTRLCGNPGALADGQVIGNPNLST
jgi:hypothetical protein